MDTRTGNSRLAQQACILGEGEADMNLRRRRTITSHKSAFNDTSATAPEWLRNALKVLKCFMCLYVELSMK